MTTSKHRPHHQAIQPPRLMDYFVSTFAVPLIGIRFHAIMPIVALAWLSATCSGQEDQPRSNPKAQAGKITSHAQGLHGYIGFGHEKLPAAGGYSAGMGFYAAVWPLVDQPLANFQIGLPSSWIQPDNSDNKDKPLAPEGTLARNGRSAAPLGAASSKPWKAAWATGRAIISATARPNSA